MNFGINFDKHKCNRNLSKNVIIDVDIVSTYMEMLFVRNVIYVI